QHRLQGELLRAMSDGGRRPAVVLEMIDVDQQPTLDAALAKAPGDGRALADAVRWEARGWPAFELYAPIFSVSSAASLPIFGGNFPTASIKQLFHGTTAIDDATRVELGVDAPLAASLDASSRRELEI